MSAFPGVSSYQSSSLGSKFVVIGVVCCQEMRRNALFHKVLPVLTKYLVIIIVLTAFALAPPVRLGTVQAGSGTTRAGVYQGSLLFSIPGGALRPGSQAGLRRLIINSDRVSAGGHAKGRPTQVAFSLVARDCCPLRVVACAAGRSSVRVVTRTAGVKFSMCGSLLATSYCK